MSNLMADLPRLTKRPALFLDFDGTLAPIQDDPDTVAMPGETLAAINRLQLFVAEAICIISGRDIRDLSSRVPLSHWRAGGHRHAREGHDGEPPQGADRFPDSL